MADTQSTAGSLQQQQQVRLVQELRLLLPLVTTLTQAMNGRTT